MNLLDALSGIGTVLDTPGAMLRTGLAGENPFAAVFDTDKRVSGRDLLERYGLADENEDQGWIPDMGDIGGFAAEMLLDPTNLIGGLGLAKRMMGISKAKTANRATQSLLDAGAMSDELARKTRIRNIADGLSGPARVDIEHAAMSHADNAGVPTRPSSGYVSSRDPFDTAKARSLSEAESLISRLPEAHGTYKVASAPHVPTPEEIDRVVARMRAARRMGHVAGPPGKDMNLSTMDIFLEKPYVKATKKQRALAWAEENNVNIDDIIPQTTQVDVPWSEYARRMSSNVSKTSGDVPGSTLYSEILASHPLGKDKAIEHLGHDSVVFRNDVTPTRRIMKTEDGYTFHEQPDGSWVDNLDPEKVDMSFDADELADNIDPEGMMGGVLSNVPTSDPIEQVIVRLLKGASAHESLAPPLRSVPRTRPLAALLAGYNALTRPKYGGGTE